MEVKATVTKFMTKIPYIFAGITLFSFVYKFTLGIMTPSVIFLMFKRYYGIKKVMAINL